MSETMNNRRQTATRIAFGYATLRSEMPPIARMVEAPRRSDFLGRALDHIIDAVLYLVPLVLLTGMLAVAFTAFEWLARP